MLGDSFAGTDFATELDIKSLARLSPLAGQPLPDQPLTLRAAIAGDHQSINSREFIIRSGDTDVSGSLAISNPDHPLVELTLRAERIDLRPFTPDLSQSQGAPEANRGSDSIEARTSGVDADSTPQPAGKGKQRLIPDIPLDLTALAAFDAVIDIDIGDITSHARAFHDLRVNARVEQGALFLEEFAVVDENAGNVAAKGFARPIEAGSRIALEVTGHNVNLGVPATTAQEVALLPRLSVTGVLFGDGTSLRELLGSANGFLAVESGEGQLPPISGGLLTNDFLHELINLLNPFKKAEPYTKVECSALTATLANGVLGGQPFFTLETEKLDIFARAKIELGTEKLFASFNTVPQKGLGVSASKALNPFIGVGGTLASPSLTLDPANTLIHGSLAFATGGMSLLAKNFTDRLLADADPCKAAVEKITEKRQAIYQQFMAFE